MINYPQLSEQPSSREMVDVFKGYNHNLRIGDGEFYDMENLSSDCYPVLSPRKKRGTVTTAAEKITGVTYVEGLGILYADGAYLRFVSNPNHRILLELNDEPKRFVRMGAYLIIWPDMKYFNTQNPQDYGGLGHSVEVSEGEVTFELCTVDGETYGETAVSATAPKEPEDQSLWIDTSSTPHVLKKYAADSDEWVTIETTYVRISGLNYGTDGQWFSQYDGVTISGITGAASHLNGAAVLQTRSNSSSIVIVGMLDETVKQVCTATSPIRVERRIPAMDHVIEAGNRLWGCRYGVNGDGQSVNEIYASKLGDFRNWNCFMGISTDSWVGSVGSQGEFTGAANIGGYPVFYKNDTKYKVWISETGAHRITSTPCQGVQNGCGGSVAIIDGAAIYKSTRGFCVDDGGIPVEIGQCFGAAEYSNAVGAAVANKYYVSMQSGDEQWHLFVYDAEKKMWHREDGLHAAGFGIQGNTVFAADADANRILDLNSDTNRENKMEETVRWMAETGDIGLSSPDMKYISRLTLRLSMEPEAELTVYARYDMEPEWVALGSIRGTSLRSFSLPIRPRRCDHLRLRFEGEGDVKLYSITKTIEEGSECP